MAVPDVERKIFFYAADVGKQRNGALLPFDPVPVLQYIASIPTAHPNRRLDLPEEKTLYCWVDDLDSPLKARLATIKRSDFPSIEALGMLSPLRMNEGEGLADEIHVVFFANNVLGAIYNHQGPRISALARYMRAKAKHIYPSIRFVPLVDPDTENRLNGLEDIRLVDLKMEPSMAEALASQSKPIGDAFASTMELFDAEAQVEIVARRKPRAKGGLGTRLLEAIQRIYRNTNVREHAERFKVEGINDAGEKELIDLLSDDLVVRRKVLKQDFRTRAVRPESAFSAIEDAYQEVEHKLEHAQRLLILRSDPTEEGG